MNSKDFKAVLENVVEKMNKRYNTNVSIRFNKWRDIEKTTYNYGRNLILFGIQSTPLSERNREKECSIAFCVKALQYVLHEFFHSMKREKYYRFPELDPLMTIDLLINDLMPKLKNENHPFSLDEIEVEKDSWNELKRICVEELKINGSKLETAIYKNFYNEENEFLQKNKKSLLKTILVILRGETTGEILNELEKLEMKSRACNRVIKSEEIDEYVGIADSIIISKIEDNIEQGRELIKAAVKNDGKIRILFDSLVYKFPYLENFISEPQKKMEIDIEVGIGKK